MNACSNVYVVGTDEAGYGPNLGPLLVGVSCWRVDLSKVNAEKERNYEKKTASTLFDFVDENESTQISEDDYASCAVERLNVALAPTCSRQGVFPLVDSKVLYGASKSLAALERSFWIAACLTGAHASDASFQGVLRLTSEESNASEPPWERGVDFDAPVDSKTGIFSDLAETASSVRDQIDEQGVDLVDLAARRVQPLEFNALLDNLGLKSELIADVTTSLLVETIARVVGRIEPSGVPLRFVALCDKLGGRDRYASILSARFPGAVPCVVRESRASSVYRFQASSGHDRRGRIVEFASPVLLEARFTAKGESNAPTALASIVAKYLRELSMRPFNEFWRRATGNDALRPTAGYPVDALRFRAEVEEVRRRLGVSDEVFWRAK